MKNAGKIIVNSLVFLIVAGFIWYMARSVNKEETTLAETVQEEPFDSPYRLTASFELPEEINRFELCDGKLILSAGTAVYLYDTAGNRQGSFRTKPEVRDIAAAGGELYVLYPAAVEVYSPEGGLLRQWEACSELSDYCSLALAGGFVFVTDAENKNICRYTPDGQFTAFISSPQGFIIPSYSFDIASRNDTVYCANSGRHLIESYTSDGRFIAAFGTPGAEAGAFAGCCNPAYLSFTPDGDLLASEKGIPRVSRFGRDGSFKEVLLDSKGLGGGHKGYETRAGGDMLFVAGKKGINVYQLKNE